MKSGHCFADPFRGSVTKGLISSNLHTHTVRRYDHVKRLIPSKKKKSVDPAEWHSFDGQTVLTTVTNNTLNIYLPPSVPSLPAEDLP